MTWTTLISPEELAIAIDRCVVIDCRHDLMNPQAGSDLYAQSHIPGACFLHQDHDLAGTPNGHNGRHPLPDVDALAARLRACGLRRGQQLVAYDGQAGMYASRLWWLARWLGHETVAVLDGGLDAWTREKLPVTREVPAPAPGDFSPGASLTRTVSAANLLSALDASSAPLTIIDARAPDRYRGETEPMDPVAGHIPGALNRPFAQNLRPDGRFKPAAVLRAEFDALLGGRDAAHVVQQCGSGVSACHNLFAMVLAGKGESALYPGSWSEWCSDPTRPVARGASA